jgi:hypothetical protein
LLPLVFTGAARFEGALDAKTQTMCTSVLPKVLARTSEIFPWFKAEDAPAFSFHEGAAGNTPASPWAGGYYAHARRTVYIQHVPLLITQGRLQETILHECVHAALAQAGHARLPLWLEEGAALYFAGQIIGRPPEGARRAKSIVALEALIQTLSAQNDEAAWLEIRAAHAQARRLVSIFIDRFGTAHFVNFLRVLKDGTHFTQALASYYALEPEEADAWL